MRIVICKNTLSEMPKINSLTSESYRVLLPDLIGQKYGPISGQHLNFINTITCLRKHVASVLAQLWCTAPDGNCLSLGISRDVQ